MSQEKGIQTSFTSLTYGAHSQLVSNSSIMFSKFKVEKLSNVLYKRGARHFEAEKSVIVKNNSQNLLSANCRRDKLK